MSRSCWVMYKKEMLDAIRDRRSVFAALSYSFGTPLLMCVMFVAMIDKFSSPEALYIEIENAHQAPELIRHLGSKEIFPAASAKEKNSVKDIRLIIGGQFFQQQQEAELADVTLEADLAEDSLRSSVRRLERGLREYSQEVAALRLLTRGVSPSVIQVMDVTVRDLAKPEAKAGFIVGIAIFMMIYAVFISGMNLAIDTSAGERERNSLALMLSLPIHVADFVWAKLLAVASFSLAGLVLIILVSKIAYAFVPWQELGFVVDIDARFALMMMALSWPLALLAAGLQLYVSFMAKTFKEAQSYLTLVLILPMGMAMVTGYDLGPDLLRWLPVSGQQKALMDMVKGNDIQWLALCSASAVTLLIASATVWALIRSLRNEKTVFAL